MSTDCSIQFTTECPIQMPTECPIQFITDCPIQFITECPVQFITECPVQLSQRKALLNSPYIIYYLIFTVTTVTFGVKSLIYNMLSGDRRGDRRVAEVAVEAVFFTKNALFLSIFRAIIGIFLSISVLKSC